MFERLAVGVVGVDEEPTVAAVLDRGLDDPVRDGPGVVDPVQVIGAAARAGENGRWATGEDRQLVTRLGHLTDGDRGRRERHVGEQINALCRTGRQR